MTRNPLLDVVLPMRETIVLKQVRGRPRQFIAMWLKSRCSILFHLLVPGGRWRTRMVMPSSHASICSSTFQARCRALSLPPQSAVIMSSVASGYADGVLGELDSQRFDVGAVGVCHTRIFPRAGARGKLGRDDRISS